MTTTYVLRGGKLIPKAELQGRHRIGLQLMPDLAESFVSPVDGSVISSRSNLREHNIRNGVSDVGNDPAFKHPKRPSSPHQSAAPVIARLLRGERS